MTSATEVPTRANHRFIDVVQTWRLDIALAIAGILFGAPSLAFPFGHDQGVHYYVGREWALRGAIPYRDTFDYKTPGIFAIHAMLVRVLGEQQWGIRLAELGCVLVLGLLCARLLEVRQRGVTGFVCLTTFVVYYGYTSFWDTAQCELWAATFAVAGIVVARRSSWHPLVAGVLASLAFLMKPPAILMAIPAARDCWRRSPRSFAYFVLGLLLPVALTALYFALHGAMGATIDVLVGANAQYVLGTRRVDSPGEAYEQIVDIVTWYQPFGALLLGGALVAGVRSLADKRAVEWPRLAIALGALALAAICVQLKFYRYHFTLLVPALVLAIGAAQARWLASRPALAALVVGALWGISGQASRYWMLEARAVVTYVTAGSRNAFADHFSIPGLAYNARDNEEIGDWLRAHTTEDEPILVRAFQPEIYAVARRHAPGRFFWTTALTDKKRTYNRAAWLDEDARAIATNPRFVVTIADLRGPDAPQLFIDRGYVRCHAFRKMLVLSLSKTGCDLE